MTNVQLMAAVSLKYKSSSMTLLMTQTEEFLSNHHCSGELKEIQIVFQKKKDQH